LPLPPESFVVIDISVKEMKFNILHKLNKVARNTPNLLRGYNIYVDSDKLRLIDHVYRSIVPNANSFVDLGGVWNVNGAYSLYTIRKHRLSSGVIVDTDYPSGLEEKLTRTSGLRAVHGDFTCSEVIKSIGTVDVAYFFDVLLHQANPTWADVLSTYASVASCFVIFNQQYVQSDTSIRLTHLPLDQYLTMSPHYRQDVCRFAYEHANELHPVFHKPWIDIHNIFQWAITDHDLNAVMTRLGYRQLHFRNCGPFPNLPAYENHAFVFVRS
jgi:hypothetical protein